MKQLTEEKRILQQRRLVNNLILNIHIYVVPSVSAFLVTYFYGINNIIALVGCIIAFYMITIGLNLIIPYCNSYYSNTEKELRQLSKAVEHIKTINWTLDEHRDKMLFDEDPGYWKILEELNQQEIFATLNKVYSNESNTNNNVINAGLYYFTQNILQKEEW